MYYAFYEIVIRVKGKINGRTIHPKVITGKLKYTKSSSKTYAYIKSIKQNVETFISKFEWEDVPRK